MPEFPPPPPRPLPPPPPPSRGGLTEEQSRSRDRRNRIGIIIGSILIVASVAWLGRTMLHDARAATSLVGDLHNRMEHHDIDSLYTESDAAWKQKETIETTRALFSSIDSKLGAPLSTSQLGFRTEANTTGSFLSATYSTRFEQDADAKEFIVWKNNAGKFRLYRYRLVSPKFNKR